MQDKESRAVLTLVYLQATSSAIPSNKFSNRSPVPSEVYKQLFSPTRFSCLNSTSTAGFFTKQDTSLDLGPSKQNIL